MLGITSSLFLKNTKILKPVFYLITIFKVLDPHNKCHFKDDFFLKSELTKLAREGQNNYSARDYFHQFLKKQEQSIAYI